MRNDETEKDKYFHIIKFPKNKTLQEIIDSTSLNKNQSEQFWGKLFPSETTPSHSESKERLINSFHVLFPKEDNQDAASPQAKQKRLDELKKMSEVFQILSNVSHKANKPKGNEHFHKQIQRYHPRKYSSSSTYTKRRKQRRNRNAIEREVPVNVGCGDVDKEVESVDINVNEDMHNVDNGEQGVNVNDILGSYNQILFDQIKQRCCLISNRNNIDLNTMQYLYGASLINGIYPNNYNYLYSNALQMQLQLYSNYLYFQLLMKYQTYSSNNSSVNNNTSLNEFLSVLSTNSLFNYNNTNVNSNSNNNTFP